MNTKDTNGISVGDELGPGWLDSNTVCCIAKDDATGYLCTARAGHDGPHVATAAARVVAVWP